MDLNKIIKIMGMPFEIILTKDRSKEMGASNDGASVLSSQKIFLDTSGGKEYTESVLIHGIIETIDSQCELELNHKQISTLSANLYQVLKDNDFLT